MLLALLCGFAVKVPLFPLHTWLPLAHTEAPTAGSVLLAGVLLKLGTYAMYRFAIPSSPLAVYEHAPAIGVLAIIGIIYAGLICWVQYDIKKLVAYSSVSHLGFCVLGPLRPQHDGASPARCSTCSTTGSPPALSSSSSGSCTSATTHETCGRSAASPPKCPSGPP